jgi:hypothetical protein
VRLLQGGAKLHELTRSLEGFSYSTTDGTARAGKDYVSVAGTLSFAPMEKEKVIVVPLLATPEFRGTPYFFVVLGLPSSPAALDQPAKVHIIDQEVGLVQKGVLHRFDGSLELLYSVTGQNPHGVRVETSFDLKNWREVELNYWTNPTGGIFSPQEKQGFLRVRVP